MASKGPLLSGQIAQLTKIPLKQVRESLFVLIHHGLVKWSQSSAPTLGGGQDLVVYHLQLEKVFMRLAYPSFIRLVKSRLGSKAAEVVLEVAKLGRCPKDQLDQEAVEQLMTEGFLTTCTLGMSKIETDSAAQEGTASAPASAASSPKKRKAAESPVKTKRVRFEGDAGGEQQGRKVYLCLAIEKFVNAVWYEQLVSYARHQVNDAAGEVMEATLNLSQLSAATSRTLLNSFQIGHKMSPDTALLVDYASSTTSSGRRNALSEYLEVMARDISFFQKAGEQAGGQYYVDFPAAAQSLQTADLLAFIKSRFGAPSARIFRVLLTKKYLEEKSISKIAMVSGKEARERLFVLLQHGFLHLQEVPRTADHAPSRTIYLWTIPFERLCHQMKNKLKHTQINLMQRIQHERNRYKVLITKTERSDVAANPGLLSSLERAQLQALTSTLNRLEHQILRISTQYLLYQLK